MLLNNKVVNKFFDIFFTPQCPFCLNYQETYDVCGPCFQKIDFLPPACKKCQEPFQYEIPNIDTCAKCQADTEFAPFFENMYCALQYNEYIKNLIVSFKNQQNFGLRNLFSKFIAAKLGSISEPVILVPVPLYKKRLIHRGYNQSIILARAIADLLPNATIKNLLVRTRDTNSQKLKTVQQRFDNVHGAFALDPQYKNFAAGKNVIIVDDVITTGATVFECAKILHKAKCKSINIAAIARRVKNKASSNQVMYY